ncbi:MAG: multicatalytic endopeptidase, partial [Paramarteilia canceri]
LLNRLQTRPWYDELSTLSQTNVENDNVECLEKAVQHISQMRQQMKEEKKLTSKEKALKHVGTLDHPKHIMNLSSKLIETNLINELCSMLMISSIDRLKVVKS